MNESLQIWQKFKSFFQNRLSFSANSQTVSGEDSRKKKDLGSRSEHPPCLFCDIPKIRIIAENDHCFAILDGFPVTRDHTLVFPKRHVSDFFALHQSEVNAIHDLLCKVKSGIETSDSRVSGFNIGINNGESAGQTIFHCHIHLIPRRQGDVENPRGGVRGVIPGKQSY